MITLTPDTCKALLKFASKDKSRPNMYGIGVHQGSLAATDGHCAVTFYVPLEPDTAASLEGRIFPRPYVEQQLRLATALKTDVSLEPIQVFDGPFPPISQILPPAAPGDPLLRLDPQYLALLPLVAKACQALITCLSGGSDGGPVRFDFQGQQISACVIMVQPVKGIGQ